MTPPYGRKSLMTEWLNWFPHSGIARSYGKVSLLIQLYRTDNGHSWLTIHSYYPSMAMTDFYWFNWLFIFNNEVSTFNSIIKNKIWGLNNY